MTYNVFIDGSEGTTGLKIFERFSCRNDVKFIRIDEDKRKDAAARAQCINSSDFTFLCLPDSAAIESVSLCTNPSVRILDASTAHRTAPGWDYGLPELGISWRDAIRKSHRVAVPGCYASGFISIVAPLIESGIMPKDYPASCYAVSGYSGAGKKAIAQYEDPARPAELSSPRLYALSQQHKHLNEMQKITGLSYKPIFLPNVCNYFSGMAVTVPLHTRLLTKCPAALTVWEVLGEHYENEHFIRVAPFIGNSAGHTPNNDDISFIPSNTLSGTNYMTIYVYGNDERVSVTSVFDNLGKGASGAAVQCMNIMMGIDEATGLE